MTCPMLNPQLRLVSSRTRSLKRLMDFEWMRMRGLSRRLVKLNPRYGRHPREIQSDG